jgi:formylglycine-generating enzyme required for sulfatase activity
VRGGSWRGTWLDVRSAARAGLSPRARRVDVGFRCAKDADRHD